MDRSEADALFELDRVADKPDSWAPPYLPPSSPPMCTTPKRRRVTSNVLAAAVVGKGLVGRNMLVPGAIGEADVQRLRQVIYAGTG